MQYVGFTFRKLSFATKRNIENHTIHKILKNAIRMEKIFKMSDTTISAVNTEIKYLVFLI